MNFSLKNSCFTFALILPITFVTAHAQDNAPSPSVLRTIKGPHSELKIAIQLSGDTTFTYISEDGEEFQKKTTLAKLELGLKQQLSDTETGRSWTATAGLGFLAAVFGSARPQILHSMMNEMGAGLPPWPAYTVGAKPLHQGLAWTAGPGARPHSRVRLTSAAAWGSVFAMVGVIVDAFLSDARKDKAKMRSQLIQTLLERTDNPTIIVEDDGEVRSMVDWLDEWLDELPEAA
jgi:hypothetical protein